MNDFYEALELAQEHAHVMLTKESYDAERDIPMRVANSHTDLWPGDRWVEAYIADGEPDYAVRVMDKTMRSLRPDGALPHLLQGSHIRGGVETRWADRIAYIQQGNGITKLKNGEWVTKTYGMPTLALSAFALAEAGIQHPDMGRLEDSMLAHFAARGNAEGAIQTNKVDELTSSKSPLADKIKTEGSVVDPAVNALAVLNYHALRKLGNMYSYALYDTGRNYADATTRVLYDSLHKAADTGQLGNEEVLALARLQDATFMVSEADLRRIYEAPGPDDSHSERTNLTMAECIEVARLTPYAEASQTYLARVLPMVAQLGTAGITRFEGVVPGGNALANKYGRKQLWLPTAAEIARINAA